MSSQAVKFARANDLLVAVRGGGHNVGGRALCDDGIVIDLSAMKGVFVDPDRRTVAGAGRRHAGRRRPRDPLHGLAVPAGVVSRTGIAGLTLGGGVGWLVRKYGLTCDNVLSFEVVTADGEVVTRERRAAIPICSGRCAAAAAISGSSPRSFTGRTRWRPCWAA